MTPRSPSGRGDTRMSAWSRPLIWSAAFLACWITSATIGPAQALGYQALVDLGAVRQVCPSWLLAFAVSLGSLPVTVSVFAACALSSLVRLRSRKTLRPLVVSALTLLLAATLPLLGLHIYHGWFPHYATFPSGHMAGFLLSSLSLRLLSDATPWRRAIWGLTVLGGSLVGVAILSTTAHTFWDVLGSACLALVVLPLLEGHKEKDGTKAQP